MARTSYVRRCSAGGGPEDARGPIVPGRRRRDAGGVGLPAV